MVERSSISLLSRRQSEEHTRLSSDCTSLENYRAARLDSGADSAPENGPGYSTVQQQEEDYSDHDQNSATVPAATQAMSRRIYKERLLRFGWWWEVYATLLAVASTAAMVAVLLSVDGKLLSSWPLYIQPASLVAIFSAIAKSALLVPIAVCLSQLKWSYFENPRALGHMQVFDDASRGPWGALVFLWKTRATALLASVGALATVCLPSFEAFSQQAVHFISRDSLSRNETASLAFAHSMSDWPFFGGAELIADVRLKFTIAMMAVMTGRSSVYDSNLSCPGAECRFPNFTSLAACTVCDSESVQINNEFGCTYYTYSNATSGTSARKEYAQLQPFQQAVARDSGHSLSKYGMDCSRERVGFPTFYINLEAPANSSNTSMLQGMGRQQASSSSDALSNDAVFGNTYISRLNDGSQETRFKGNSLRFCTSGFGREFGGDNGAFDTINTFTCLGTHMGIGDYANLQTFGSFRGNLTWCRVSLCAQEYQEVVVQNGTAQVGSTTQRPLRKGGENSFNDTEATADGEYKAQFDIGPKSLSYLSNMMETVVYSKDFAEFLVHLTGVGGADWQTVFERMGDVATDYIKSTANADARNMTGDVFALQSFVQVRWEWLVMPLLMVVVSLGFFVGTAVYSRRSPYLFKSSILALIFYGLDGWDPVARKTASGDRETDEDVKRLASGVKAAFVSNRDGSVGFVQEQPA